MPGILNRQRSADQAFHGAGNPSIAWSWKDYKKSCRNAAFWHASYP
ncbi:hypothetical protein [Azospirillum palustre]